MAQAQFARKAATLHEIVEQQDGEFTSYTVEAEIQLSRSAYMAFVRDIMGRPPYDVTKYRGGDDRRGGLKVVRVVCAGQYTLLCDAEGYSYVRYVAIEG